MVEKVMGEIVGYCIFSPSFHISLWNAECHNGQGNVQNGLEIKRVMGKSTKFQYKQIKLNARPKTKIRCPYYNAGNDEFLV
jgi:hypothetical protein